MPARPARPARVDPTRWLRRLDRWRVVRKVDANGTIMVEHERYDLGRALAGQRVVVAVDAAARKVVVHHQQRPLKRLPRKGLLAGPLAFDEYLEALCREVRSRRRRAPRMRRQAA